jgi:predicted HTH domain antitoxin
MQMQKIEIEIPNHILGTLHQTQAEFGQQMKVLTAVRLYLSNDLSLEQAAELAGKSRWEFENLLSKNEIPISLINFEDYQKELGIMGVSFNAQKNPPGIEWK